MIEWTKQDADMAGSRHAILRAAHSACRTALTHGLPIAIWRNNEIVEISPEQIKQSLNLPLDWGPPIDGRRW